MCCMSRCHDCRFAYEGFDRQHGRSRWGFKVRPHAHHDPSQTRQLCVGRLFCSFYSTAITDYRRIWLPMTIYSCSITSGVNVFLRGFGVENAKREETLARKASLDAYTWQLDTVVEISHRTLQSSTTKVATMVR
jgi:hypothetical protein